MLTVRQAAVILGLSPTQVRRLCEQGRLGEHVGPIWVITQEELDRLERRPRGRPKKQPEPPK
jgi:hypothetical protein